VHGTAILSITNSCASEGRFVQLFLYLQLLDVATTLVGFRMGLAEASPFVNWLTQFGPILGLVLSKVLAVGLLTLCITLHRPRVIRWAAYWYIALLAWNLFAIGCCGAIRIL
jgi:hypothetical protein